MVYTEVAGSVLMSGPSGYLVSLGLESILDSATATMCYNYIALGILFFLAAFAGSRNEAKFCVVIPMFSGLFVWWGWLHSSQPVQSLAVIIICGLLGVMIYMNEVNHEKYGVKGPGSKLMNIVLFIVLFQVALGFTNTLNLFPSGASQATPTQCAIGNQSIGATCDAYGNLQLSQSVSSVSNTGGLLSQLISVVTALPSMILALVVFLIQIGIAIVGAPFVINATVEGLFPGISSNAAYIAFMVLIGAVFYYADLQFLIALVVKPFPGEVTT